MNQQTQELFKNAPYSSELNYSMGDNSGFWNEAIPQEAIEEVKTADKF